MLAIAVIAIVTGKELVDLVRGKRKDSDRLKREADGRAHLDSQFARHDERITALHDMTKKGLAQLDGKIDSTVAIWDKNLDKIELRVQLIEGRELGRAEKALFHIHRRAEDEGETPP